MAKRPFAWVSSAPMTGDYANYGTSTRDGAQIAVDEINEAGGVNGYTFVLDTQDSQGDPDSAVSAYGKLMDNGMNVVPGLRSLR